LFAVHPLRVESVAWVSERKDVLSGLFFMLTLIAYHWHTRRPSIVRYVTVLLSFAFGLMSKPMLVTLPFVLLLLDLWPLRRWELPGWPSKRVWLEKLPLLGLVLASCWITVVAQRAGGAVSTTEGVPWAWRLVNAPVAYVMYLSKTILPSNLSFLYLHPAIVTPDELSEWLARAAMASLLLLAVTAVVIRFARQRLYLVVGWLWFLGMLVPVIGLIQVGFHSWADRYAYLPMIGLYIVLAWGLSDLVLSFPSSRVSVAVGSCLAVVLLSFVSYRQVAVWRDDQTLFTHGIEKTKNNYVAHDGLGNALTKQGRFEEAIEQYEKALQINPRYVEAHFNAGGALQKLGQFERAVTHYEEVVRHKPLQLQGPESPSNRPNYAEAHNNLGVALARLGRVEESAGHFQKSIHLRPQFAAAHYNWGKALTGAGRLKDATKHYENALSMNSSNIDAHYSLGLIDLHNRRANEAEGHFEAVLSLDPNHAEAHNNLGVILAIRGQTDVAVEHFATAVRLKADYAEAKDNLRQARAQQQARDAPDE
jgi:tetratricopeptide (TPR) repeat protein